MVAKQILDMVSNLLKVSDEGTFKFKKDMVLEEEILKQIEKRDVRNLCSLRATRRILEYYWNWEISEDTVKEANKIFNAILCKLAKRIIKAHVEYNDKRKKYHLREKLRLSIYKNFLEEVHKWLNDFELGTTGQYNRETVVSDKEAIEVT